MNGEVKFEHTAALSVDDFPSFCRSHGLKCTAQRIAVFKAVRESDHHPSVDEIWQQVKRSVSSVTRESVYRILNEFAAMGLLARLDALPAARYDTWLGPHAHFICESCGAVLDFPLPQQLALPANMPRERRHVELRVTGRCPRCVRAETAGK